MITSPSGSRPELPVIPRPSAMISVPVSEQGTQPTMPTTTPAPMPYGLGLRVPTPGAFYHPGLTQAALEFQRVQVYDYHARLQFGLRAYHNASGLGHYPGPDPLSHPFFHARFDPRARLVQEEPKPQQSYIGLIGMAILSSKEKKLVLSDIYQWILDNYSYFRNRAPGWRNSIRHNLSLNDCFIKTGRSANGKGHYWAIHPANVDDFKKGDFRRRKAQRRVRKAMGLAVPDDEDSPSPPPPPSAETEAWRAKMEAEDRAAALAASGQEDTDKVTVGTQLLSGEGPKPGGKRRLFDMESLLAPDDDVCAKKAKLCENSDISFDLDRDKASAPLVASEDDELVDVDTPDDDPIPINVAPIPDDADDRTSREASPIRQEESNEVCSAPSSPKYERTSSPSQTSPASTPSGRGGSPAECGRMSWVSPGPLGMPMRWSEHTSAFQATSPGSRPPSGPWGGLQPSSYPLLAAPFPVPQGGNPADVLAAQQRWQEAFSRMVARSYSDKPGQTKSAEWL